MGEVWKLTTLVPEVSLPEASRHFLEVLAVVEGALPLDEPPLEEKGGGRLGAIVVVFGRARMFVVM